MKRLIPGLALTAIALASCSAERTVAEDARLQTLIAAAVEQKLALDPTEATKRTASGAFGAWTPVDDEARAEAAQRAQNRLDDLAARIDVDALTPSARLDYEIYASTLEYEILHARAMRNGAFLYGNYLEPAVDLPDILVASHGVKSRNDAENYIARLEALPGVMDDTLASIRARHAEGVTMMKSAYAQVARRASFYAAGAPCGGEGDNPLSSAFRRKLQQSELAAPDRDALAAEADRILSHSVCPAYERYIADITALAAEGRDAGAWSLPDGERFYRDALELSLGEKVDPKDIHAAGLAETARLQEEMRGLMREAGFDSDIQAFNEFLRSQDAPSLPNTPDGKARYVALAEAHIARIYERMPAYFDTVPQTDLVVEVPALGPMGLPPSAGAFYTEAPVDGSRPAIYNLGAGVAPLIHTWALATTTYHEIAPGHHHQVETYRAIGRNNAYPRPFYPGYFDGWAVYAEELAGEMGGYDGDLYSRIGWLQAQLTRAIRMVLDTGLNAEGWTPEQAAAYQEQNGAMGGSVNRFLIWPGQGLSYYWGYLEFRRLRREAEERLGDRFDIKAFHRRVLEIGPAPLSVLDFAVNQWIEEELADAE